MCQEKPKGSDDSVVWISTQNSREALAILASNYYERPSAQLKLVGRNWNQRENHRHLPLASSF